MAAVGSVCRPAVGENAWGAATGMGGIRTAHSLASFPNRPSSANRQGFAATWAAVAIFRFWIIKGAAFRGSGVGGARRVA